MFKRFLLIPAACMTMQLYASVVWGEKYGVTDELQTVTIYREHSGYERNANPSRALSGKASSIKVKPNGTLTIYTYPYTSVTEKLGPAEVKEKYAGNKITVPVAGLTFNVDANTFLCIDCDAGDRVTYTICYASNPTYTVIFHPNGATATATRQIIERDTDTALYANSFTMNLHSFQGWALTSTGSVKYVNKEKVRNIADAGGSRTLYAVWKKNDTSGLPNLKFSNSTGWPQPVYLSNAVGSRKKVTTFEKGKTIYLYCSFANNGGSGTPNSFKVFHKILDSSSKNVGDVTVSYRSLSAGCYERIDGSPYEIFSGLPIGKYTYKCQLDSSRMIEESSEQDNQYTYEFEIVATTNRPNLAFTKEIAATAKWPQAVFLGNSSTSATMRTTFNVGDDIYLYACFINNGSADTGSGFKILHEVLDTSSNVCASAYTDVVAMEPNGSRWFYGSQISILQNLLAGQYTYRCTLDYESAVSESDEGDNVATCAFKVGAVLSSISISGVSNVTAGSSAAFACTAMYSDGTSKTVSPTWTISSGSSSATISSSGVFTAKTDSSAQPVTVKASYTEGDVTKTATQRVTIHPAEAQEKPNLVFSTNLTTAVKWPQALFLNSTTTTIRRVSSFTVGKPIYLYGSFKNVGKADVESRFSVLHQLYDSSSRIITNSTVSIPVIKATYGRYWGGYRLPILQDLPAGKYTYKCTLDSTNVIAENDETDNVATCAFEVVGDAATHQSTVVLNRGYTWVSVSVMPTNAAIGAVFAGATFVDEDVIKSAEGSATYYGGKWYGELTTIKPGVAYMVKMSAVGSQTLTVTGSAAATSVDVVSGWNWIGPTATAEVLLDALTHSGGFFDEDVIKSAEASATYYGGKWYGELKSLQPGVGYKAKFAKGGTLTFGNEAK